MSGHGSRRRGARTLPPTADPLLGRREVASWLGIPPSTVRRLADAGGAFDGGCTACTLRGGACLGKVFRGRLHTVRRITRQHTERAMAERFDSLAAHRLVARDLADHARQGVGRGIFFGFNGHDTHWTRVAVPMPGAMRPSCPRCARERGAPHRAQGRAALASTRADPRACSALRVRPRTAASKAARACRPCTAPARMNLRRGATPRQGAAHPTPQPRCRPRGMAPCTAH